MLWQVLDALTEVAFEAEFLPSRIEKERKAVVAEAQVGGGGGGVAWNVGGGVRHGCGMGAAACLHACPCLPCSAVPSLWQHRPAANPPPCAATSLPCPSPLPQLPPPRR